MSRLLIIVLVITRGGGVDYRDRYTLLCKVEASVSSSSKEEELSLTRRDGPFFLAQSLVEYEDLDSSS